MPAKSMQCVCSPLCAAKFAAVQRAKRERQELTEGRMRLRTHGQWVAVAQTAFNSFVRARDAGKPCICCGKPFEPQKPGGSMDAGHYLSRGSSPHLRFDERNVHGQRKNCNRPGGTTRDAFRAGLIERIGLAAVEALEADHTPRHYSVDELKRIKAEYTARARELRKAAE